MTFLEQILLTIITAFVSSSLVYFGYGRKSKADLEKDYESRFNEKKWEVYIKFVNQLQERMNICMYYLLSDGNSFPVEKKKEYQDKFISLSDDFNDVMRGIQSEMLLISSKDVVEKYFVWKEKFHSTIRSYSEDEYAKFLIDLLNAMREDLGKGKSKLDYKAFDGFLYNFKVP